MFVSLITCVIVLPALGLGYYAVYKMKPGSLLVRTSLGRILSLQVEIKSANTKPELVSNQKDGEA